MQLEKLTPATESRLGMKIQRGHNRDENNSSNRKKRITKTERQRPCPPDLTRLQASSESLICRQSPILEGSPPSYQATRNHCIWDQRPRSKSRVMLHKLLHLLEPPFPLNPKGGVNLRHW